MKSEYLNNDEFESIILSFQESARLKVKYELIIDDLNSSKQCKHKIKTKKTKTQQKLEQAQFAYQEACELHDLTQHKLAVEFMKLAENLERYARYRLELKLPDECDTIQEGVVICFDKLGRFDPKKGKAFNYLTTCILNHFRQLSRTTRSYQDFKKKYMKHQQDKFGNIMMRNGRPQEAIIPMTNDRSSKYD